MIRFSEHTGSLTFDKESGKFLKRKGMTRLKFDQVPAEPALISEWSIVYLRLGIPEPLIR